MHRRFIAAIAPPPLAFADVKALQTMLARAGYDVGKIDGFLGLKTRQAVKAMQMKYGLPADSYPTAELLGADAGRPLKCILAKKQPRKRSCAKNKLERNAKAISRSLARVVT